MASNTGVIIPGEHNTGAWGLTRYYGYTDDAITRAQIVEATLYEAQAQQATRGSQVVYTGSFERGRAGSGDVEAAISLGVGKLPTPAVPDQKHLLQCSPRPREDLEDLREAHGLRIEELESLVATLLERLESLEARLSTAEDRLWGLRDEDWA